jgi:hypothetical protein
MAKKKKRMAYFYVYPTYHGVSSETSCLHVGYTEGRPPKPGDYAWEDPYVRLTFYSIQFPLEIADEVYEKVKRYNNCSAPRRKEAEEKVKYWIDYYMKASCKNE